MRHDQSTHASVSTTWEPENSEGNIPAAYDFSVFATCDPEGVEITSVHLLAVHTEGRTYPAGGEPRRAELEAEFFQWIVQPAQVFILKQLEDELCQDAHDRDQALREDAEERRAEARLEHREATRRKTQAEIDADRIVIERDLIRRRAEQFAGRAIRRERLDLAAIDDEVA